MNYTTRDIQARLNALGFDAGVVDGINGPKTKDALERALKSSTKYKKAADLFHPSGLQRVIMHWTGGKYNLIDLELNAYHVIILEDGKVVYGHNKPEANVNITSGNYAAHTRSLNSGSIGVSMDAMWGATEVPFSTGDYPLTWPQIHAMAEEVANLCDTYDIPISKWTVLTHAEVERTLGVKQRAKWDITWLPDMSKPGDPITVGNRLRELIIEAKTDTKIARKRVVSESSIFVKPVLVPQVELQTVKIKPTMYDQLKYWWDKI